MCHLLCSEARCNPADEGGRGGHAGGRITLFGGER